MKGSSRVGGRTLQGVSLLKAFLVFFSVIIRQFRGSCFPLVFLTPKVKSQAGFLTSHYPKLASQFSDGGSRTLFSLGKVWRTWFWAQYVVRLMLSEKVASTSVDWDQGDITLLHTFEDKCVDTATLVWLLVVGD